MLPFHSLCSYDRTFIPDFCFKILSLTNCGKALELPGKDFSQDFVGSSDCPSEESEASLVIFLGQTRGRIQGQTRGQKAKGPKVKGPQGPKAFWPLVWPWMRPLVCPRKIPWEASDSPQGQSEIPWNLPRENVSRQLLHLFHSLSHSRLVCQDRNVCLGGTAYLPGPAKPSQRLNQ